MENTLNGKFFYNHIIYLYYMSVSSTDCNDDNIYEKDDSEISDESVVVKINDVNDLDKKYLYTLDLYTDAYNDNNKNPIYETKIKAAFEGTDNDLKKINIYDKSSVENIIKNDNIIDINLYCKDNKIKLYKLDDLIDEARSVKAMYDTLIKHNNEMKVLNLDNKINKAPQYFRLNRLLSTRDPPSFNSSENRGSLPVNIKTFNNIINNSDKPISHKLKTPRLQRLTSFTTEDITNKESTNNMAEYIMNSENNNFSNNSNVIANVDNQDDLMEGIYVKPGAQYVTFEDVEKTVTTNYTFAESIQSTTLDIISLYLKGQKILYTEAKVHCEQKLYALMLPAIFISALCTVLSLALKDLSYGSIFVSSLTAINTFVLGIVTYLKLDAKAEAHKSSAASFDNLQTICEFYSGKILFGKRTDDIAPIELLENIELKVREIKEKNNFVLPELIRYKYKELYLTNIFGEVKRIQNKEIVLINELKIMLNEMITLEKFIEDNSSHPQLQTYKNNLQIKHKQKNAKLKEILEFKNAYIDIDTKFRKEIDDNIKLQQGNRLNCCRWLKT